MEYIFKFNNNIITVPKESVEIDNNSKNVTFRINCNENKSKYDFISDNDEQVDIIYNRCFNMCAFSVLRDELITYVNFEFDNDNLIINGSDFDNSMYRKGRESLFLIGILKNAMDEITNENINDDDLFAFLSNVTTILETNYESSDESGSNGESDEDDDSYSN